VLLPDLSRKLRAGNDQGAIYSQNRALELSQGKLASPFVSLAESVAVEKQDKAGFQSLLNRALAINPDVAPESRLQNLVAQRRARWLLGRVDELFLDGAKSDSK